jgi:Pyruvate/2-oxoacid:ferredoxin oxidoreductase gamma subunit
MARFRRVNEQGWEVQYEVPEEFERLLEAKATIAGATDGSPDMATIFARLYINAAMNGFALQTTMVDETKRRIEVTVRDARSSE